LSPLVVVWNHIISWKKGFLVVTAILVLMFFLSEYFGFSSTIPRQECVFPLLPFPSLFYLVFAFVYLIARTDWLTTVPRTVRVNPLGDGYLSEEDGLDFYTLELGSPELGPW
jgi:hypothetical protein